MTDAHVILCWGSRTLYAPNTICNHLVTDKFSASVIPLFCRISFISCGSTPSLLEIWSVTRLFSLLLANPHKANVEARKLPFTSKATCFFLSLFRSAHEFNRRSSPENDMLITTCTYIREPIWRASFGSETIAGGARSTTRYQNLADLRAVGQK
ncbi:hypothetical protein BJX64DRAFT_36369 [Aspergillus heterothallicus]